MAKEQRVKPRYRTSLLGIVTIVTLASSAVRAVPVDLGPLLERWTARYNGRSNSGDHAGDVAVGSTGARVYVTGSSASNGLDTDYVTIAYDAATGAELWVTPYNGPGNSDDHAIAVTVAPDESRVYVTGSSYGSGSLIDYGTVAYDAATGSELWTARYDGPASSFDSATVLILSADGSRLFVTGSAPGTESDSDFATVAYDTATGTELWVSRFNGPANLRDYASALAVSSDGARLYVAGSSFGTESVYDYAMIAYDAATGFTVWTARYNGPRNLSDVPTALTVSPDGARVYVTGHSGGSLITSSDYATLAYDAASGTQLWATPYNGPANGDDDAHALAVGPDGALVYVTGFSFGFGTSYDYGTVAYDGTTGNEVWSARYNGLGNRWDSADALVVSPDGARVYVTGDSDGLRGIHYATIAYESAGGAESWVARYNGSNLEAPTDSPSALAVSGDGKRLYVTGGSFGDGSYSDYATVAYCTFEDPSQTNCLLKT